jgi:hypothetical protein
MTTKQSEAYAEEKIDYDNKAIRKLIHAPAELEQVARSAFEAGRAVYSSTDNVHVWNDFNHWQTQNKNLTIKEK